MTQTLRVLYPEWQGGVNPNYILGAQLMNVIVPKGENTETVKIPVSTPEDSTKLKQYNNINHDKELHNQVQTFQGILKTKQPQKIVTIGGDCSSSLAPFNYLSGKYGKELGIIWLDAHPDISNDTETHNLFEMVVSTLLNKGAKDFNPQINHPINDNQVLMAGLIEKDLRPMDQNVKEWGINYLTPQQLKANPQKIIEWINKNHFKKIAIHFDLDVLNPTDFRSIYPAEPGLDVNKFPAAVGELSINEVGNLLHQIDHNSNIVGLTIAEHIAWDAINLKNAFNNLSILSK